MSFLYSILLRVCLLTFVFVPRTLFSQNTKIDSLKHILANSKDDTSKVNTWNELSAQFRYSNDFENAARYADSALYKAKKTGFLRGEFTAYRRLGSAHWIVSNAEEAFKNYSAALALAKKTKDKSMIASSYGDIGYAYNMQNNFAEAFKNYFTALKLQEQVANKYEIAATWRKIGSIYIRQNNQLEAINSCTKALRIFEEDTIKNKEDIAGCHHFLGRAYLFQGNYDKALDHLETALKIWKGVDNKSFIAGTTSQIGLVYENLGVAAESKGDKITATKMYQKCLEIYRSSLKLFEAVGSSGSIALSYMDLGNIHTHLKKLPEARIYLSKALQLAILRKSNDIYRQIYQSLSRLDSAQGNYKLAFEHYKLYIGYKDSILNQESTKKTEGYKLQYEFDKREDSLKQKQFITETKLKAEKNQRYFYWIGLTMLSLLSFFVFLNFRNQKKLNRLAKENFAKERTELELQTLRTQLNPHFIFNCISSIDGLIQANEKYNATNYLNKFAKLMRNVLENSKANTVTFSNDIETLKLYLDLEQLRNEDKYSTQLNISEELKNTDYIVPPLIIQPFVENAIQHGLKNKPGKSGLLKINISRVEDHLQYIIADNGIGRQATEKDKLHDHRSYGVQMSMDRIKLFNNEASPSIKIEDITNDGIATGTTVTVKLKLK